MLRGSPVLPLRRGRFDIDLTDQAHRDGPDITKFIDQRIAFVPDPAVPRGGVQVTMTPHHGATAVVRQEHALGTPPFPATWAQIEDKFLRCASPRLSPAAGGKLLAQLSNLDQVADCADLLRLTRPVVPGSAG
jgi:2-methylcitrate dehydratase PrpD